MYDDKSIQFKFNSKMRKNLILRIILIPFSFLTFLNFSSNYAEAEKKCEVTLRNKVINWTIKKLDNSSLVSLKEMSCQEISEIVKMDPSKVLITTGRKRGERVICISDNKDFPCKNYLATIVPSVSSFDAMTQIFEVKFDRTKIMNETVERLYITPSELIE